MLTKGRVGGGFDSRILHTERAYNYKVRATWLTPEVLRASARLAQLRDLFSEEATRNLVMQAESAGISAMTMEFLAQEAL